MAALGVVLEQMEAAGVVVMEVVDLHLLLVMVHHGVVMMLLLLTLDHGVAMMLQLHLLMLTVDHGVVMMLHLLMLTLDLGVAMMLSNHSNGRVNNRKPPEIVGMNLFVVTFKNNKQT